MRVVHIVASPLTLGFLRGQMAYMTAMGMDMHVISPSGGDVAETLAKEGVQIHHLDLSRSISPLRDLIALWRLVRILRRLRPQILHSHTSKAGVVGMLAGTIAGVDGRIHHLRGLPSATSRGLGGLLVLWSDRLTCTLAHEVLVVSESLRRDALEKRVCRPSKLRVMGAGSGQGVDADTRFNPSHYSDQRNVQRSLLRVPPNATVVGYVGRFTLDKGLGLIHEAWQSLRTVHPTLHLLLVGSMDDRRPLPEDLMRAFTGDPRVSVVNWTADIAPLYAAMDLVVLPTYREGFPNVLLEAGAMQLPVVATAVTGCLDAVVENVTGVLIPPGDSAALAAAIEMYLASPELMRSHGKAGRQRALREFRPESIWQGIACEYERLVGPKQPRQPV